MMRISLALVAFLPLCSFAQTNPVSVTPSDFRSAMQLETGVVSGANSPEKWYGKPGAKGTTTIGYEGIFVGLDMNGVLKAKP